jgi:two-component system response regulator YesN
MGKKTILLVEDDHVLRDLIRGALEREYNVLEASSFSEAKKKTGTPIDLALIDYDLPDGTGLDIVEEFRSAKPHLPVILVTAYGSEQMAIKALRSGVTDYIRKPLSVVYLMRRLAEILEGKKDGEQPDASVATRRTFVMDCIEAFIGDNSSENLTRDILAERAHMDRYEFSRAFNERFGKGVKSYLNTVRVKKAAELLGKNRELSVTDIAFLTGFEDLAYFDRLFKETYGISPIKYRRCPVEPSSST